MHDVVSLRRIDEHIALVTMEDRAHKNTFSRGLVEGLLGVFARIEEDPAFRVVVVTGYDAYFACGGTREELLRLHRGEARFDEFGFYRLLLDCALPTIAAMQGHAQGGGLAFGCYADVIVMGRESLYSANFMNYGFTPGMGSTYILPRRLGSTLAAEMLMTGASYHGGELQARGAPGRVAARRDVLHVALEVARELADKPLVSLKLLKGHLAGPVRAALAEVVEQEIAMHEVSFRLPEVKERIEALMPRSPGS